MQREESGTAVASLASVKAVLSIYLKGVFMGAADSVPGVSGGTIALITGVYERLITALTALDPTVLQHVPRLYQRRARQALVSDLVDMDVPFLLALGLGAVSAVVGISRVVHRALTQFPALTFAFFFGLIAASAVVLYGQVSLETPRRIAVAVIGIAIAFFLSGVTSSGGGLPGTPLAVLFAGMFAITAMILPGVSGAFLLLLMGQYEFLTGTLKTFVNKLLAIPTGGSIDAVIEPGTIVVSFMVGGVVGLLTIAHVIRWSLSNYRQATLTFLVSLMVGALRLPAAEIAENTSRWTPGTVVAIAGVALVAGAAVILLDRYTDDLEYADSTAI
jgi:putative membrane protein